MSGARVQKISSAFDMRERDGQITAMRTQAPFFLRQGDIDSGCGIYCALMGLVVCGAVSSSQAINIATPKRRAPADFWRAAAESFFLGSHGSDVMAWVNSAAASLKVRRTPMTPQSLRNKLPAAIEIGAFVMARIGVVNDPFDHWVVIAGVEGGILNRRFEPTGLLILDPHEESPRYRFYNAMIRLGARRKLHRYVTEGFVRNVTLVEMLVFHQEGRL